MQDNEIVLPISLESPSTDTIAALGELRPRQKECIEALVAELEEAASSREGWLTQVPALVDALARIGAPAVRRSVRAIGDGLEFDTQVAAHARVIGRALGRYGDEWIKAEVRYADLPDEAKERLLAAQRCHQDDFTGGGVWGLP